MTLCGRGAMDAAQPHDLRTIQGSLAVRVDKFDWKTTTRVHDNEIVDRLHDLVVGLVLEEID